jgi:hypothetical protein
LSNGNDDFEWTSAGKMGIWYGLNQWISMVQVASDNELITGSSLFKCSQSGSIWDGLLQSLKFRFLMNWPIVAVNSV